MVVESRLGGMASGVWQRHGWGPTACHDMHQANAWEFSNACKRSILLDGPCIEGYLFKMGRIRARFNPISKLFVLRRSMPALAPVQ